jgi:hypothetical protein
VPKHLRHPARILPARECVRREGMPGA